MKRFVVLMGMVLLIACGREGTQLADSTQAPQPPVQGPETSSITTSGSTSCVEQYSLETLNNRTYAFDGTITKIEYAAQGSDDVPQTAESAESDNVSFDVTKWFKGGSGADVVRRAYNFGEITSAGTSPHKVGERLLVAGDEDFIWECGFTQPYDSNVAADWERTLSP